MNDLGLVSVLPFTYFASLGILTISFLRLLIQKKKVDIIFALHILMLIIIFHLTPQIVYGTLRYSWAWKHVGIVDFIQRNGAVDPNIGNLNAYHNWPGFFALAAMYNVVAGLSSSLGYAGLGPFFFNLLDFGALFLIYKSLTIDNRLAWLSIWLFYLFSWVGQDYFSPQAFSYFLYLVALAMLLRWFRRRRQTEPLENIPRKRFSTVIKLYNSIINRPSADELVLEQPDTRMRVIFMAALVLLFIVIASSHQLTPLMLVSALSLLVIFQVTNQRYLPILMAVVTMVWVTFMAVGFLNGNLYWIIKSIGSLLDNVNGNLINLAIASPGQQLIAKIDRLLSAVAWVLGLMGFIRRIRTGHWDLAAALLAIAPLPLIAINSYGGEMIFRVYMFSLPFVVFFAAALFFPDLKSGTSRRTFTSSTILSLILIPGFLFSYYGKERMYYFSPNEIAAAQFIFDTAPKGSLIIDGIWDWPRQFTHYEDYNYLSILLLDPAERLNVIQNPVTELQKYMDDAAPGSVFVNQVPANQSAENEPNTGSVMYEYPAAYIVITRSQIAESEMTGTLPADWSGIISQALSHSPNFQVVFSNPDAVVFKYLDIGNK